MGPETIALATFATIIRVLILILLSILTGWCLAYLCIRYRNFENLFVPLINTLESIPVMGFFPIVLVVCVTGIGGTLGVEVAVAVLVFDAVVWNIWMGIYQSFKTVPGNLLEVSENYDLSTFRRMKDLYIPHSIPRITSNVFSSFADAFFYITASEVFTVGASTYQTFGIGTLISTFLRQSDLVNVGYSLLFIGIGVVLVMLWTHHLSRWAVAKYGVDTRIPIKHHKEHWRLYMKGRFHRLQGALKLQLAHVQPVKKKPQGPGPRPGASLTRLLLQILKYAGLLVLLLIVAYLLYSIVLIILSVPLAQWHNFLANTPYLLFAMGVDYVRVFIITLAAFGLAISLGYHMAISPRISKIFAPVLQAIASFPAPTYFPLIFVATLPFLKSMLPFLYVEIYIFVLGFLSCFYYVLFDFWIGVQAIPSEYWDVMRNYDLGFFQRMRYVILPAAFPYLVIGLSSTINSAWAGLAIGEYWQNIYNGYSLEANVGMMKYLTLNIAQGHIDNAAWISLLFAIVVAIYAIFFIRNLMDLARKKYVIEEGLFLS